jgi:hypothetical protein
MLPMPPANQLTYGKRRALNEIHSIFSCQWSNGMLPHIRFVAGPDGGEDVEGYRPGPSDWGVTPAISGLTPLRTSGITQPPIIGLCVYETFLKFTPSERAAHLSDFLTFNQALRRFHSWLFSERDPLGENLVSCLHPWETGTDNSPAFDRLNETVRRYVEAAGLPLDPYSRADSVHVRADQRPTDRDYGAYFGLMALFRRHDYRQREIIEESPFLLQDVLFNSLLAASLLAQAELQSALSQMAGVGAGAGTSKGELQEGAAECRSMYGRVAEAIRRKLWHQGDHFYYAFDARENRPLPEPTVSGFVPLLADIATDEQAAVLVKRLRDPGRFWTAAPIPSTSAKSPSFDPIRYWSGPSWPVTNWLVVRGLRERGAGLSDLAETLRTRTLDMIAEGRNPAEVQRSAAELMEVNSVGEDFTTPSRQQYLHGWLWDSAIVAACWPLVAEKPSAASADARDPGFWEYYHPHTGAPLGAARMTWTASLYLELLNLSESSTTRRRSRTALRK